MTISQSREEGKGLLFLSRQNGLLSPPVPLLVIFLIFLSTTNRQKRQTTKQSWCFLFFRNKLILKLIFITLNQNGR